MQQRTLGDLRAELADRLNMSAQALSPAIERVLNSFLREAHDNLCQQYEWPELRCDWVFPLVPGQTQYPLPVDADGMTPDVIRIADVSCQVQTLWYPLREGIEPWRYSIAERMRPRRWDVSDGNANPARQPPGLAAGDAPAPAAAGPLEIWPPPDQGYNLRVRGYPEAQVFGARKTDGTYDDAQKTQCDARLVFLMALANAKAHYGKPDAQVAANELTSLLGRLRARRHGNYRYIPGADEIERPERLWVEPKWVK